jgi:Uma2 family endonuclease
MSVADYLAFEATSAIKHEFVGGEVHAMSGASKEHNLIALNIASLLRQKLRGGLCQVFMSDFKVCLEVARDDIFYYPDVVVSCHTSGIEKYFLRFPTLIVEVLSPSTEHIDRREKLMNYRTAQTLEEYVVVSQERREVTIFRRAQGWGGETHTAPEARVEFLSLKQALSLAEIYEGVF